MNRLARLCIMVFAAASSPVAAQTPTAKFLLVGEGARAEAIGQAAVSNAFDFTGVYWNPALLSGISQPEFGFKQTQLPGDVSHSYIGLALPFKRLSFGLRMINENTTMDNYDLTGASSGKFDIGSHNLNIVAAYQMTKALSLGFGAGNTSMQLANYSAQAGNFNVGALYKSMRFALGFSMANLGGGMSFTGEGYTGPLEPQPQLMRLGASYWMGVRRQFMLAFAMQNVSDESPASWAGGGLEYWINKFIAVRAGMRAQDGTARPAFGLGLAYSRFAFNFTVTSPLKDLENTDYGTFDLSIKFGAMAEEGTPSRQRTRPSKRRESSSSVGVSTIAVSDFAGKNVSQADASIVADFLRTELVNTGSYNVVEKANMDKVLAEAAFQQSGCTTSDCAAQIGKILNVKEIVVGSLSKLMDTYYITINIVDVETGRIIESFDQEAATARDLKTGCRQLADKLLQSR